jgi:malate synthase
MFRQMLPEELTKVRTILGPAYDDGKYEEAAELFDEITTSDDFVEFLTLPAYGRID